jgi:hypothetical protein
VYKSWTQRPRWFRDTKEAPHGTYVLHRTRCSQAKDQLLREGRWRAIAAAKKKNDRIDANKICDCLRCDFLPECYMAPTAIRERRRTLRYRKPT